MHWRIIAMGVVLASGVWANGGGYTLGGVDQTGSVSGFTPEQTQKVQILDEQLSIELGPRSAQVEVRYLMRNVSDSKAKVRFGFPVEVKRSELDNYGSTAKPAKDHEIVASYCRNYQITTYGKPIDAEWQTEQRAGVFNGIAGWMVSEFKLDPGGEMPMCIRYSSDYPYDHQYVSDNSWSDWKGFKYRLSTAACWAGSIKKGRIVISAKGIRFDEVSVIKPVNRFKKQEQRWIWDFEELEPALADDLEIRPLLPESEYGESEIDGQGIPTNNWISYVSRGNRWFLRHSNYAIKASSTLAPEGNLTYVADHLKQLEGTWSEGLKGNGVGEWLELTPKVAKILDAVVIRPGCWSSQELFAANARPKKIKVELNDERAFEVDVPDQMEEFQIPIIDYKKPVAKVKMTFLEVWPGRRFEDLCMTSIQLNVVLDKEPKIRPAR